MNYFENNINQEFGAVEQQAAFPASVASAVVADQVAAVQEQEGAKPYTLRKLCAKDIFPFAKIISKIGIKQFQDCFTVDESDNLALSMSGLAVALNVIDILLANLERVENEIYVFLAGVSGLTVEEIQNLDMDVFATMIIEIFQKKEFADFFKAVSRLLGLEN